jgi:hypothetical protein
VAKFNMNPKKMPVAVTIGCLKWSILSM